MKSSDVTSKTISNFHCKVAAGKADECWLWTAARSDRGYGKFRIRALKMRAHRVAYMLHHGEVPDDLCVLHSCDNPPCCNPAHLFLGTHKTNAEDRDAKGRGAKGDRNGSRLHPERLVRGLKSPWHTCPEKMARGERVNTAILTADQVIEIRRLKTQGNSGPALARRFGCSISNIFAIVWRKNWKHIP